MHEIKHYMKQAKSYVDKELDLIDIVCSALNKLKSHDENDYKHIMCRLHCLLYGFHFDELTAKEAVACMRNADGSIGQHWSYEQATNLANQHGVKEVADLYYAINMLHSDLCQVMGSDVTTYVKMAKALYFTDPDAPEGKLFMQWFAVSHK